MAFPLAKDTNVGPNCRVCADGRVRGKTRRQKSETGPSPCLTKGCTGVYRGDGKGGRGGRGLCSRCYASARFAVSKGKVTWAELEELGLAQPVRPKVGMIPGLFMTQLAEARKRKTESAEQAASPATSAVPDAVGLNNPEMPDGGHE